MWEEFLQLRLVCGKSFNFFASIYIPANCSKLRKHAVFTTILLAIWGRLRLSELLCTSAKKFKPSNAFLCNDLKYIESNGKDEVLGVQLWIRHTKVPDPLGALVEIRQLRNFQIYAQ